ncbi:MAG TPA: cob(I)yrinic acid a,c-diamide adenosyltransferase [Candidatus Methanofastidiosa archaeon]|nr:cob(I)yrinic acid a,c-diamide adenosyltransferase [Candidatus Methanofastidiosa archaeon]HPR40939.1 cob(I)yrinic acid a,c-diamide adenosyltransferase [Candidatus Methanofastidiosa archaeon]
MKGYVHAYFGDGVGKTTRSVGLAVRASGAGKKVFFFQFLKDDTSSEVAVLRSLPNIEYGCTGTLGFIFDRQPTEEEIKLAMDGVGTCKKALNGGYDLVIADEILNVLSLGLAGEDDMGDMISGKGNSVELVMTGRACPGPILERCDYATEFKNVKHPHEGGLRARMGIDC